MTPSHAFWRGKRVFVTGHTGFKGSWLSLWLAQLGAHVHGFALSPPTQPSLFDTAGIRAMLADHVIGDVRDAPALTQAVAAARPDIVLHLAAQPLVRASYDDPVGTYATNVMGTVHLLDAVRRVDTVAALVNVTTDKCYENREWAWGYRENEALGGHDPYSSSKACSELVTAAYRASFHAAGRPFMATARAGNVIGGGDWANDRLLPDALRALDRNATLTVRYPDAVRPWQHVLEPLSGYLTLAESLVSRGGDVAEAWNFGPVEGDARPVRWVLERLAREMPDLRWEIEGDGAAHEANFLMLDSAKSRRQLGWAPRWRLSRAIAETARWHAQWRDGVAAADLCAAQIADFAATVQDD